MSVEQTQGYSINPVALVEALRERGEDAAADAVERVPVDSLAELEPGSRAIEARSVMGALERDRGARERQYLVQRVTLVRYRSSGPSPAVADRLERDWRPDTRRLRSRERP